MENTKEFNHDSCGDSLDNHIATLLYAMVQNGLSIGCVDVYRALVEMADYVQRTRNFEPHIPTGKIEKMAHEAEKAVAAKALRVLSPGSNRTDN